MELIQNINWHAISKELKSNNFSSEKTNRNLAIASFIGSFIFLFVFPLLLILTVPMAFYFWLENRKLSKNKFYVLNLTINRKERWHRAQSEFYRADDSESVSILKTHYVIYVENTKTYELKNNHLTSCASIGTNQFFLHDYLYNKLIKGSATSFIMSNSNDIMAYFFNDEYHFLKVTKTLSNKQQMSYNTHIPQYQQIIKINHDFKLFVD